MLEKASFGKAVGFGVVIWMVGFVWGSVVFMTPALKELPAIPLVSRYPAISFPLLVAVPLLAFFLGRSCLRTAENKAAAGLPIGAVFAATNLLLDLLILVLVFRSGWDYFASLTVWLGYGLLLSVPWITGRLWASWYSA